MILEFDMAYHPPLQGATRLAGLEAGAARPNAITHLITHLIQ